MCSCHIFPWWKTEGYWKGLWLGTPTDGITNVSSSWLHKAPSGKPIILRRNRNLSVGRILSTSRKWNHRSCVSMMVYYILRWAIFFLVRPSDCWVSLRTPTGREPIWQTTTSSHYYIPFWMYFCFLCFVTGYYFFDLMPIFPYSTNDTPTRLKKLFRHLGIAVPILRQLSFLSLKGVKYITS